MTPAVPHGRPSPRALPLLAILLGLAVGTPADAAGPTAIAIAAPQRDAAVDFQREILPVLQANCLACHNQTKAKGDLVLESPASILKGGASGPGLVPGKGAESLVLRSAAHQVEDLVMPPAGNKANARDLSPAELGLLQLWIDQGARGEVRGTDSLAWSAMPTNWSPVLSVALAPDGQFAYAGRANRIDVYRVATRERIGHLADPGLPDGAAHLDTVNALAASPDGTRVASGGYREAKVWQRLPLAAVVVPSPTPPAPRSGPGRVVGRGADGTLTLAAWKALPALEVRPDQPVLATAISPDGTRLAAALASGRVRLWSVGGDKASEPADLPGDARLGHAITRAEQALALARADLEFHKGAVQRADEELKKSTNALAKAVEKHAANEKDLATRRDGLKAQKEAQAGATRERDDAAAALGSARRNLTNTLAAAEAARVAAKGAVRRAADARLAAEQAARARADLERVAGDLAGKADEAALLHARELASNTARDAQAKALAAEEAAAAGDPLIEKVHATAFDAGRARAAADRAEAELPAKVKGAEDRLAAASKAIGELEGSLKKAEIAFGASEFDVGLSRTNTDAATRLLATARATQAATEASVPALEAGLTLARSQAAAAALRPVTALAFSQDGTRLATLDAAGSVQVWTAGPHPPAPLDALDDPALAAAELRWPDPGFLEFLHSNAVRRLPLVPQWTLERTLGGASASSPLVDRVNALAFSPDGTRLATGSGEPSRSGPVHVWRTANGTLEHAFPNLHSDAVLALAFGPAGDLLLSGGADRFMRLTEPASGRVLRQFEGHTHHVPAVAWRRDGRTVASAGAEGVVKTWNRLTGDRIKNVDGFGKEVSGLVSLGITDQFLAVSGSSQARVFRENGEQVRTLPAGNAFLHAVAVTPDGLLAAAGGDDGILRLWTVSDGKVLAELPPPAPPALTAR